MNIPWKGVCFLLKGKWPIVAFILCLAGGGWLYSTCKQPKQDQSWESAIKKEDKHKNADQKSQETNASKDVPTAKKSETIMVDVKGAVQRPGVYEMKVTDRVQDAIRRAGGLTDAADRNQINLAKKLSDEMVIYLPKKGEQPPQGMASPFVQDGSDAPGEEKVNINTASEKELENLPGIGPSKAAAIAEYREKNGPFKSVDDLINVSGIGEKSLERIKSQAVVH